MPLKIGDEAPDFELQGVVGERRDRFRLSEHRDKHIVLAFYPADFTPA